MRTQCVITGCALLHSDNTWTPGDLHKLGDAYIFVGSISDGQLVRISGSHRYERTLQLRDWFDRRGVYVFSEEDVVFNVAALEYMGV